MKKVILLLCLSILLCGCASGQDAQVEAVREQILALPSVEEFAALDGDARLEAYNRTQAAYDAYMSLTEKQRQQLSKAEEIFENLFSWFNSQVMPLMETAPEITEETTMETTVETTVETTLPDVILLTEEEKQLLLKLGMAERGDTGCTECIALVMRTVLNRVEADRFPSSVRNVIYAQDQFTPVMDGSFETAEPNDQCYAALEMVIKGWDESQGALFYEWCEGESWHSKNLELLFQHCDTRYYK